MTIASHIGQYRILRKIGAGGMGRVFLGEHTLLGRRAAIKTLLPAMSANAEIVDRFFNEARATSAISDPGIIQVFDFGYHVDGTAYIVMELLEGEALSARIARLGKLSLGDALRMARQIAGSLAAAHACDIVHRDLKPENIFLVADVEAQGGERTKILDFGVCKLGTGDATLTQSGAMVGTPVYMSPEQCRGTADVDCRSDVYAFGCLMFHMLAGRPPFVGEASGDLIVAHLEEAPPALSGCVEGIPREVDALVLRCLAKAPEERFPSMSELQYLLGELYAGLDAPAVPVSWAAPAMPLGHGFRSLYDGNFGAGGAALSTARLRMPWLRIAPSPASTATAPTTSSPGEDADDADVAVMPRRRAGVRVAIGGLVALGLVFGMIAASSAIYRQRGDAAEATRPRARPIEAVAPVEPPATPVAPEVIEIPVTHPRVEAAAAGPADGEKAIDRPRRPREAPRDNSRTGVRARPRLPRPDDPAVPAAAASTLERPSQPPLVLVSSAAASDPVPPVPPPSTSPPPRSAPPNPPGEDLYDTR